MPQIIAGAAIGMDQVGFPTVVKAAGRIPSPIDNWYLWCAPHDTPGGIFLFTAPDPDGPWTIANGGAAVLPTPAPYRHVSSPYVLWLGGQLVMFCHMLEADPSTLQPSFRATSSDGITWDLSLTPIIPEATGDDLDTINQSYLNVCVLDGVLYGYYQASGTGGAKVMEITSTDNGVTWTKTRQESQGRAWLDYPGHTSGKPHPVVFGGDIFVHYTANYGAGKLPTNKYRRRLPDGTFSREWMAGIQPRPSQWDAFAISIGDVVWDGTQFHMFYSANPTEGTSTGEAVGVASCTFPLNGFPTEYGKG